MALAQSPIDLIKVDLKGGEEDIIPDLLAVSGIRILISFYYNQWKTKTLTRFKMQTPLREAIERNPFGTVIILDGSLLHVLTR